MPSALEFDLSPFQPQQHPRLVQRSGGEEKLRNLDFLQFGCMFGITNDAGEVVVAQVLPDEARVLLGFDGALRDEHRGYLAWHRERVFRKDAL